MSYSGVREESTEPSPSKNRKRGSSYEAGSGDNDGPNESCQIMVSIHFMLLNRCAI